MSHGVVCKYHYRGKLSLWLTSVTVWLILREGVAKSPCRCGSIAEIYTELRFHDLRHTFATHALASGVDAKTLSGILGHTKASFTLDTYTHTTGDMQKRASEIVGGFLTDYLGEEMAPWQNAENTATAVSA